MGRLMTKRNDSSEETIGLLIPIGILFIVFLGTGVIFILIPIFILLTVLGSTLVAKSRIHRSKEHPPEKPIYDQWRKKEEGISIGILIPILILGWFFVRSGMSWPFLIPLFVLVMVFFGDLAGEARRSKRVRTVIDTGQGRTLSEIADSAGVREDQAILQVVHDKRRGQSDVWFDPSSGTVAERPTRVDETRPTKMGCVYCGFALREEDRFCPYCGAPIRMQ